MEGAEYIEAHSGERDEKGHHRVVSKGSMPERGKQCEPASLIPGQSDRSIVVSGAAATPCGAPARGHPAAVE